MIKNLGLASIIIFAIVPILLWYPSTTGEGLSFRHLGQALALTGATLFSINFILAARLKFLEKFFNGLNQIYIVHHLVGEFALIFLLFHPLSIGIFYWKLSLASAFSVIFPPFISGFATWFGLLALLTIITLLILTLYVKLPYHIWKLTHKLMGVALAFALVHVLFINSTITSFPILKYYILFFFIAGLSAYSYRTLLGRFLVKRTKFKVSEVKVENEVTKIALSPIEPMFEYKPGQFIFVKFATLGISREEHPFSLTSWNENGISIAPKSSGDYTKTLKLIKSGAEATVEGPFGTFSYIESFRKKQIWIAGGIGITPFMSMAKSLNTNSQYDIYLYYIVKTPNEAIFMTELQSISSKIKGFKIIPFFTNSSGHLTADEIVKSITDFKKREIFICGPVPMMDSFRSQFNKLGVRNSHIRSEEFALN